MGTNLRRRGGIYWFRRRVPDGFKTRIGRAEISYSLRTASPHEARSRAKRAWLRTEALFAEMSRNPSLAARQAMLLIEQLSGEPLLASPTADELVDALLDGDGAVTKLLFNRGAVDLVMGLPEAQRRHVGQHMALMIERMDAGTARMALAVSQDRADLEKHIGGRERGRADGAEAALAQTQTAADVAEAVTARLSAIASHARAPDPPAAQPPPAVTEAVRPGPTDETAPLLSTRVEKFFKAKLYPAHTEDQNRTTIRLWLEIIGDKRTDRYTEEHAFDFQAALRQMPSNHGKGGHVHAIRVIELARGNGKRRLAEKTLKRHFSLMRQLWKHLGKSITNPGIFDEVEHKTTESSRIPWTHAALDTLLRARWNHSEKLTERISEETHVWLVAAAGYTGARVEEIARLRPQDVVEVEGIMFFIIRKQAAGEDKAKAVAAGGHGPECNAWTTKTPAGERAVAIHPKLLEAGILDLAGRCRARGGERIFELTASGRRGNLAVEYSRAFSHHKIALGIMLDIVLHSFRHNVETILGNRKFQQRWIDVFLGHKCEREGQARKSAGLKYYFHGLEPANLLEVATAIEYKQDVCPLLLLRRVRGELPW